MAPEITQATLVGRQPSALSANRLIRASRQPLLWRTGNSKTGIRESACVSGNGRDRAANTNGGFDAANESAF